MSKRYIVNAHYVIRTKDGKFRKWHNIGKSIAADKRRYSQTVPNKPGHGHEGDYVGVGRKRLRIPWEKK